MAGVQGQVWEGREGRSMQALETRRDRTQPEAGERDV